MATTVTKNVLSGWRRRTRLGRSNYRIKKVEQVDEYDTFLPERHYVVDSDTEFLNAISKFTKSPMKVCSIDLNFEKLDTNVDYLLLRSLRNRPYFYAALKRTLYHDQRILYRIKKFLFTNEPRVKPHIRHPLIRWRRFFHEHWMHDAENDYLIVLRNSEHLLFQTRYLLSYFVDYPTCQLVFIDDRAQ